MEIKLDELNCEGEGEHNQEAAKMKKTGETNLDRISSASSQGTDEWTRRHQDGWQIMKLGKVSLRKRIKM